jgi:hypothetical protein
MQNRFHLNVSQRRVGGFAFNNNRYYDFLGRTSDEEMWAAQQIAAVETTETLIGFGDPSVRNFLRILRLTRWGRLARIDKAADFLSIRPVIGKPGRFVFCIRELKAHKPTNPVEVSKALTQLRNTAEDLALKYPRVPVEVLEIVVPARGIKLNRGYYRTATPIDGSTCVYRLIDDDGYPIFLRGGGKDISVTVRLIEPLP